MPENAPSVLVTVPNMHWIHAHVTAALLRLQADGRYALRFEFPSNKPYENNLHHIIADKLIPGSFDFWLSIDADNPPMQNPLDLVECDLDIIGLPTPIWHNAKKGDRPVYWNVYDYVEDIDKYREHPVKDGLQRADAVGTGCFLAARRVFEHPDMQKGCFTRKLHPNGTVDKGNDIAFCERARAAGFAIYAHYGYPCRHFHECELTEVQRAFMELNHG